MEKATDAGWMNGMGDKKFDPNGVLNRAMFVPTGTAPTIMGGETLTASGIPISTFFWPIPASFLLRLR